MVLFLNGLEVSVEKLEHLFVKEKLQLDQEPPHPSVITSISLYREPLLIPLHFLVFQTADEKWWSLQKTRKGIIFKRSNNKEDVVTLDGNNARRNAIEVPMEDCDSAEKTIFDLVNLLRSNNHTFHGYHLLHDNCYMFVTYVFNKFAKVETYGIGRRYEICAQWDKIKWSLKASVAPIINWLTKTEWEGFFFHDADGMFNSDSTVKDIENAFTKLYEDHDRSHQFDKKFIEWVAVYKTPLEGIYSKSPKRFRDTFGRQWTQVDYHAFVTLKTSDGYYWSIEKQQDGIHINKKENLDLVRDKFGSYNRKTPIECLIETRETNCPMSQLMGILSREKEAYHMHDNCHHLAKRLFDKIASIDNWEFTRSPEYISMVIIGVLCSIISGFGIAYLIS